jgi:DNA polymerase elongation subunit (family B)
MGFIKGYNDGSNITILNTIYHRAQKDENGKYGNSSIDIIFKDLDTNEKKVYTILKPPYTYYMVNEGVPVDYNKMFIEKSQVHPITCKYADIKKSIAFHTGNTDFFYDNINTGNYRENDRLFAIPSVFNADMNIEDYYRWLFDRTYRNEPFIPEIFYFDIEVDSINMKGDFPEPGECPVNAITIIDSVNYKIYTLLLENYNNPLIDEFKKTKNLIQELKDFVKDKVGGWKKEKLYNLDKYSYSISFYDEEINLISVMFKIINNAKPDFALAWNIAFDLPYLIARIQILGYDPASIICHEDFEVKECVYNIDTRANKFEERGDYACISCYTVYIDQLITFASRRKGQRAVSSFKLDYIGDKIAGVRKLDYSHITTNISELPYKDYKTFVFYNIMDTIVQLCIEHKVGDIDFIYNKSLNVNTRYSKIHRQTTYLINRAIKDFWDMGYVMGNNNNKANQKVGFAGAFVADPLLVSDKPKLKVNGMPINLYDNLNDFDYKALYPSIIDENNMAPNTQDGKILIPEKIDEKENRFNNDYFNRSVWFVEDLVCHDRLNFCERYLHLAGYEKMYDDILEYFSVIKRPLMGLRSFDTLSGKRIMCNIVPNDKKRDMCMIIDNSNKRIMCINRGKMVDIDVNKDNNK